MNIQRPELRRTAAPTDVEQGSPAPSPAKGLSTNEVFVRAATLVGVTALTAGAASLSGRAGHEIVEGMWDLDFLSARLACRAGAVGGAILGLTAGGLRAVCRKAARHDDLLIPAFVALTGAGSLLLGSLALGGLGSCHLDTKRSAAVGGLGGLVVGGGLLTLAIAGRGVAAAAAALQSRATGEPGAAGGGA